MNFNENHQTTSSNRDNKNGFQGIELPSIELPKGGGAIRGIDEKFNVNPTNGSSNISIPLPLSPGRGGFTPALALQYNSGTGNGPFGIGWQLSIPSIQIKTDKGLPTYTEKDAFQLTGAEDLVPYLKNNNNGDWQPDIKTENDYTITRYRPRRESSHDKIEKIAHPTEGIFWKVTSRDNIVTFFGIDGNSRLNDPTNPYRIFKWFAAFSYDNKGNWIRYEYKKENLENVQNDLHESHRLEGRIAITNKYLKRIKYGNKSAFYEDNTKPYDLLFPFTDDHSLELVLDYGEHDPDLPTPLELTDKKWDCRKDPFSTYRSGFEIRTYRLCKRILMFHQFEELGELPYLVKSLELGYKTNEDLTNTHGLSGTTYLSAATQSGYIPQDDGSYSKKSLPPMTFEYQPLEWNNEVEKTSTGTLENSPVGLANGHQLVDLHGEGIPGILFDQGDAWYYRNNLGGHDGKGLQFSPMALVTQKTSINGLRNGNVTLQDLEANGQKQLVIDSDGLKGFHQLDDKENKVGTEVDAFVPFVSIPNRDWKGANTRFIDLNGDGKAELVVSEENVFLWYEGLGKEGYAEGNYSDMPLDDDGPSILFSDPNESIYLADFSGDGLTDIVRIRNGEVCYWPNKGHGIFGQRVVMSNAPLFDHADSYDAKHVYLADISGTGVTDILYLCETGFKVYMNLSGNGWSDAKEVAPFAPMDNIGRLSVADILGTGTACIIWSSALPNEHPLRYIDLLGSKKPHLMTGYSNSMGKEVIFSYKHSTYYYLKVKQEGTPWLTKLPFPVHVIDMVKIKDHISSSELATSYYYHHGFYDHEDREFRGFGRVDQIDQESFQATSDTYKEEDVLDMPPVLTKTWTHLGSYLRHGIFSKQYQEEYYKDEALDHVFPDSVIESEMELDYEGYREAVRNLKGMTLRQEIYTLDGAEDEQVPYTITESNHTIKFLQPKQDNGYCVFQILPRETLSYTSERNTADPRIAHQFSLSHDEFGHPLQSLQIAYPRRSGIVDAHPEQMELHATLESMAYENEVEEYYRLGLPLSQKSFEINGLSLAPDALFDWEDLQSQLSEVLNGSNHIFHHEEFTNGVEARWLSAKNTFYKEGNLRQFALIDHEEQMIMSENWSSIAYNGNVDSNMLEEAGYYLKDGHWWISSDRLTYHGDTGFYSLRQGEDVFGNMTSIGYDAYYMGVIETEDALQNKVSAEIDYRTLAIKKTTDINDTVSETLTDELGMVIANTVYGTEEGIEKGDAPISEYQRVPISSLDAVIQDPLDYLQGATTFFYYYLDTWEQGNLPPHFISLQREVHVSELSEGENTPIQINLGYSDGFGRELQSKIKHSENQWLVSGRTIYNNKEKPVKQYEPFFSDTYLFQSEEEVAPVGLTPIMHYDALGRLIRTDLPDGFHSKVEFDPWQVTGYDQNDTVLDSQAYAESSGLLANDPKKIALDKASVHYNTPSKTILDALGRAFRVEQLHGAGEEPLLTHTEFDIQSNVLSQTDPRQYVANLNRSAAEQVNNFNYVYDLLGNPLKTISQDAGTTYGLLNAKGNPLYTWNARGYRTKIDYDALHHPTETIVTGTDLNVTAQKIIYGTDPSKNQNGIPLISYDQSGKSENIRFDFKGQVLQATKQLCSDYKVEPDWSDIAQVEMEAETYTTQTDFDALGRAVKTILSDGSVHLPTYHHIGWLKGMEVRLRGEVFGEGSMETPTTFVEDIAYDSKGQRTMIIYGNGVSTSYTYDAKNYRLIRLLTQRQETNGTQTVLQDIAYVYDPVGNIVQITDQSHDRVFNAGQQVDPTMDFVYDALYQLTEATGREHRGLAKNKHQEYAEVMKSTQFAHINDANQLGNYTRKYTYDDSGNLIRLKHTGTNPFTRNFTISGHSNRAIIDEMDRSTPVDSYFDRAGNLLQLEHLASISWDYRNNIASATIVEREIEDEEGNVINISDAEYYVYDATGQRTRKVKETYNTNGNLLWKEEKIYQGGVEVKKKYFGNAPHGNAQQLRENRSTVHVMDDQKRIALVHYWEVSNDNSITLNTNKTHYQMGNHLGSASMELDDQGQLISYEEYFPFGGTAYTSGSSLAEVKLKEYRYTGKEKDDTTGLYYYGARYYAPWMCRWLNPDPAGTVDGLNLFTYVRNNPINCIDVNGNFLLWVLLSTPVAQAPMHENDIHEDNSGLYFWGGIGVGAGMILGPAALASAPSATTLTVEAAPYAPYSGDAVNIAYGFVSDDPTEIAPSFSPVSSDVGVTARRGLMAIGNATTEYADDLLRVADDVPLSFADDVLENADNVPPPKSFEFIDPALLGGSKRPSVDIRIFSKNFQSKEEIIEYLGVSSLRQNPEVADVWLNSLVRAATYGNTKTGMNYVAKNDFQRLLVKIADAKGDFSKIDNEDVVKAWANFTQSYFKKDFIARFGKDAWDEFSDIHHANLKSLHPEQAFDPENLYLLEKIDHVLWHMIYGQGVENYSVMASQFR